MKWLTLLLLITSCSTTPTGRKQLKYLPESQMAEMGNSAYRQMKSKQKTLSEDSQEYKKIRCITNRLLTANGMKPSEWSVEVFADESPNAFALPGKNMGMHTGMMKLAQNNAQLAAVMGHEIAHVKAHHGNERVSQQMVLQGGMALAQVTLGQDDQSDQLLLGALGLGAQFGVLLPFSRRHETEADTIGIEYMAKAGFDPRQASELWRVMGAQSKGAPPEFLSTHPNSQRRARELAGQAENLMELYQLNEKRYSRCP